MASILTIMTTKSDLQGSVRKISNTVHPHKSHNDAENFRVTEAEVVHNFIPFHSACLCTCILLASSHHPPPKLKLIPVKWPKLEAIHSSPPRPKVHEHGALPTPIHGVVL
jgi:hypothetical protein